jgi:hypothetical protein
MSSRSKAKFNNSSLKAALRMLQLVELIYTIVSAKIIVTIVVRRPNKSLSSTLIKDGVVRIKIKAIFRANGEKMLRLLIKRVKLEKIRSAEEIVKAGINSRVI